MPAQKSHDEIDLLGIILATVRAIRTNFWLIVIFFLVGCGIGLIYNFTGKKIYESKMIISSSILTKVYSTRLFQNVIQTLDDGNYSAIAKQFGVSEEVVKSIRTLKIEGVSEDDNKETDKFVITAQVYKPAILPDLQKGIIHFIENNEYVKIRVEQNTNFLTRMITEVESEINDLQKFKNRIYEGDFFQTSKGNVMFDPTTVNTKILELRKEIIGYRNSLQLINSVQVINSFTVFDNPSKPKLFISIASGSFLGLFLVTIFLVYKSIRKLLELSESGA